MNSIEKLEILQNSDFFNRLPKDVLEDVVESLTVETFEVNSQIIIQGEIGKDMYIITEGEVNVLKDSIALTKLGPYKIFGELALLTSAPRTATIETISKTVLLCYRQDDFYRQLGQKSEFSRSIIGLLTERLNQQNKKTIQSLSDKEEELTEMVMQKTIELHKANDELKNINSQLEVMVEQRTLSLQKTNERLLSAMQELDTFIYKASHDLKGPLSSLEGLAILGKRESQDEKIAIYFDKFINKTQDMEKVLSNLQTVNAIYKSNPKLIEVNPVSIFKDIFSVFSSKNGDFQANLKCNIDYISILSDIEILKAVFVSIIENCFSFVNSNHKYLNIKADFEIDNDNCKITITDNGIGINQAILKNVFNMFYRGSEISKGSGMGLYIAQKAIEKLSGNINIESLEGIFTTVKIELPQILEPSL